MNFSKNKTTAIAIVILLAFSAATSTMLMPNATAHDPPWVLPTSAFIVANPNPIGVGETVTIYMWIDQVFGVGFEGSSAAAIARPTYRFHNYNLTILDENGAKVLEQIFPIVTDPTSSQYYRYTPTETGTYTAIFTFPGQGYAQYADGYNPNSVLVNDTYQANSATTTFVVQQDPIAAPRGSLPLPQEYWTRPIYGEATDWWAISSNWLGTGAPVLSSTGSGTISAFTFSTNLPWGSAMQRYPGDAVGPQTGHVMWTMPLQFGGTVGGNGLPIQGNSYFEGSAYNQRFTNPIIISGILYFRTPISFTGTNSGPTYAVDIRTGNILWVRDDLPSLSFGYIYDVETPNQHGVYPPILFSNNFGRAFDAFTGEPLFNVTGVPSGRDARGPSGEHLRYVITNKGTSSNPDYYLAEWNSSKLWGGEFFAPGGSGFSPSISGTVDGSSPLRYDWNISVPGLNSLSGSPAILAAFYDNMMLLMDGSYPGRPSSFGGAGGWDSYTYYGVSLNASSGHVGSVLWSKTVDAPAGNLTVYYAGADPTVNVFTETYKEDSSFVGYSLTTGNRLWGPTEARTDFDYYGQPGPAQPYGQVAYGKLYSSGLQGIVYCYDLTNGNLLWTYGNGGEGNSTRAGLNVPYGGYPTFINSVGNGVIYTVTTEHTILTPIYKGAQARAINATDGTEIWTLSDYTGEFVAQSSAIADGFEVFFNGYDNQLYSVGRGPSATTVTAPNTAATLGTPIVIQGSVTDISAGTQQDEQLARFPQGVPAMADQSMADWMGYVYQDFPKPTHATGVEVILSVLDANHNLREIGRATTDTNGFYTLTWTPDITGDYTVYASFAGTNAYWPSQDQAAFTITDALATPPPQTESPQSMTDTYLLAGVTAIIIAIVIVGIAIILVVRKKP